MLCNNFKATMSTNACLRRQDWAIEYKSKITVEGSVKVHDHSLVTCLDCKQGILVKQNPNKFINRDFLILKETHIQLIRKRGWIFKDGISYNSLFDIFNITMIIVKPERKNENGNSREKIFEKSKQERIARFVRKHRNSTRSKPHLFSSNRLKFEVGKRFKSVNRNI